MSKPKDNAFNQLRMFECLTLAEKGVSSVSPNPMVGAVVVKKGTVVGKGYHKRFGGPHAEVFALREAGKRARGATLYVNLEPCCHYGNTPPCTDMIVRSGIKRVVIGMRDPNPLVHGRGLQQLRRANIKVTLGVLEGECKKLNESFAKFITTGLPFVTLKIAQTLDGKIADTTGRSKWITNEYSRTMVHVLRSRYDAVLVGANTVKNDDPRLTVRRVKGKNPLRVIIDGKLSVPVNARVFKTTTNSPTCIFVGDRAAQKKKRLLTSLTKKGVSIFVLKVHENDKFNLHDILRILARHNVSSVLVEGGGRTVSQFVSSGLADKCIVFVAPKILGKGIATFESTDTRLLKNALTLTNTSVWNLHGDIMIESYLHK